MISGSIPSGTEPVPSPAQLFLGFLRLGATAFGGPAIVAQMREMGVGRRRWVGQQAFDEALALAQVLPGPTAVQCATGLGLGLRGLVGAIAAFAGFVLPAFLLMLAAAVGYGATQGTAEPVLRGLRIAVIAIVAWAALDFARAQMRAVMDLVVVGMATLLLLLHAHPVLVVGVSALIGLLRPPPSVASPELARPQLRAGLRRAGALIAWAALGMMALSLFSASLASLALVMMKINVAAFGGGFAALPLMHHEFVGARGALSAATFMDGIALGQVTPGPVVITATFVGYQLQGLAGALVATAGVFFPSFTLTLAVSPFFGHLRRLPRFHAVTRSAALAFVGLLFFVTIRLASEIAWSAIDVGMGLGGLVALGLGVGPLLVVLGSGVLAAILRVTGLG